jgi:hypothetical protein
MTRMFNDALAMLEIWFFDESRMIPGYTSLTHDGKGLSLYRRLQALDLIAYSIVVIVPGSSAITYRTHLGHNITVILIKRSITGLIIT